MSIVAGIRSADQGEILLNGEKFTMDRSDLRAQLGLVPQSVALYEELSAEENLRLFGRLYGLRGSVLRERIEEGLRAAQLLERRRDKVKTFSGGMRRRLNIVAAILHRPRLLLCDEPTVGRRSAIAARHFRVCPTAQRGWHDDRLLDALHGGGDPALFAHWHHRSRQAAGARHARRTPPPASLHGANPHRAHGGHGRQPARLQSLRRHRHDGGSLRAHPARGRSTFQLLRRGGTARDVFALQRDATDVGKCFSPPHRQHTCLTIAWHPERSEASKESLDPSSLSKQLHPMRIILILVGNEFRRFSKDKTGIALTFLVPLVLIYIFGQVFGVNRTGGSGPTGIPLAIVSQTDAPVAATITSALQKEKAFKVITTQKDASGREQPLTEPEVREMLRAGKIRFALVFPPDTQSDASFGLKLKFLNNPRNEIETQTVTGLLQKTIYTSAPQALVASLQKRAVNFIGAENFDAFNRALAENVARTFGGDAEQIYQNMRNGVVPNLGPSPAGSTSSSTQNGNSFLDNLIKIETEQVGGGNVKSPMATRSVGGWAMMFLLSR